MIITEKIPENIGAVCFTGHRILDRNEFDASRRMLEHVISELAARGAKDFYCGGALGFDTSAELAVLRARGSGEPVRLRLILPSPDMSKNWSASDSAVLAGIIRLADSAEYMSGVYSRQAIFERNRALVDRSDLCVAWMKPSTRRGGTFFTVGYAQKRGVPVVNIYPLAGKEQENE
ncbi:MAG: DUF1273 family protein [Clostridia bacterium]|nr:DUF1273 family protein [Clostridia bacterium]MBP5269918.1 DUF1273 family protein [Clostridia bacterium]